MATTKVGRIAYVHKGNFSLTTQYEPLDCVVTEAGSSYVNLKSCKGIAPIERQVSENWCPIALAGKINWSELTTAEKTEIVGLLSVNPMKMCILSEEQYTALTTKDENTIYITVNYTTHKVRKVYFAGVYEMNAGSIFDFVFNTTLS